MKQLFSTTLFLTSIVSGGFAAAQEPQKEVPKHARAGVYIQAAPVSGVSVTIRQHQPAPVQYRQRPEPVAPVAYHSEHREQSRHYDRGQHRGHDRGHGNHWGPDRGHHGYHHGHGYSRANYWVAPHRVWRGVSWVLVPGFYHSSYVQSMPAPIHEPQPAYYPAGWMWVAGHWYWNGGGWDWQVGNWVRL